MKKLTLILLLIGLFGSCAYAATEEAEKETDAELQEEDKSGVCFNVFHIDETTLYYTYSTIAQTLAGAFGILGAFTMYKLQSINNSCQGIGDAIIKSYCRTKHLPEVYMSYSNRDWDAFRESIDNYMEKHNDLHKKPEFRVCYELDEKTISRYRGMLLRLISAQTKIKKQILSSLKFTVITISYSLILLPLSAVVAQNIVVAIFFTLIAVVFSIKCLMGYRLLILNALGISNREEKDEETKTQ